jgi:undecaprenyl-diphosphatase
MPPPSRWGRASAWLIAAAAIGLAWLFVAITDEVLLDRDVTPAHAVDVAVLEAFGGVRGPAVTAIARGITVFGSGWVLAIIVGGGAALLVHRRDRRGAILLAGAGAGALVAELALKAYFARPRPDTIAWLVDAGGNSFPSGHSIGAAAVYLATAILIGRAAPARRLVIFPLAAIFITAVGLSRVYLGVHWPSDVLSGLCLGASWTLALTAAIANADVTSRTSTTPRVNDRARHAGTR